MHRKPTRLKNDMNRFFFSNKEKKTSPRFMSDEISTQITKSIAKSEAPASGFFLLRKGKLINNMEPIRILDSWVVLCSKPSTACGWSRKLKSRKNIPYRGVNIETMAAKKVAKR
jgi:hypothetical protein